MSEFTRRSGRSTLEGIGDILLLAVLMAIPCLSMAVPQRQGSINEVRVIVTRFDDACPEEGSPTHRLLEWLEDVFSGHHAVEVKYLDTVEAAAATDFLRNLPAGSFIVLQGRAEEAETLKWDIRCETIVNGRHAGTEVSFTSIRLQFLQDPGAPGPGNVPEEISFLAHSALAMVYSQQGEDTMAGQELTLALGNIEGVSPELVDMTMAARRGILEALELADSIRTLTLEMDTAPDRGALYLDRAVLNARAGDYGAAVEDLVTAMEPGPSGTGSCAEYGNGILEVLTVIRVAHNEGAEIAPGLSDTVEGMLPRAVEFFDRAIEQNPDSADLYIARAAAHGFLIDWTPAREDLSTAIDLDPDNCTARARRGCVNMEMGFLDEAVSDLSAAIELAPDSASYYEYRAFAYQMLGDERAWEDLRMSAELSGGSP